MEYAFLLLAAISATVGYLLSRAISPAIGRFVVAIGIITLVLGLLVLTLVGSGWTPFWTGGLIALVLFIVAAGTLPFGIAAVCRRR